MNILDFLQLQNSLELGLIYAFMALGIFITFRILNIADLTVDGSFTLGAGVCAVFTINNLPVTGLILGTLCGAIAGSITAFLQTKLKIQPILAGILTMTGLYSINLVIMKKPNIPLMGSNTIFTYLENILKSYNFLIILIILIIIFIAILYFFFKSHLGLSIRATGDNEDMVLASSININFTKTLGLMIANALVALSGGLLAQYQGFSDANMGVGMVIMGLASLVIGEIIFGKKSILRNIIAVVLGSVIYRLILSIAFAFNIDTVYFKLISAIIVTLSISFPVIKEKIFEIKLRRGSLNAKN